MEKKEEEEEEGSSTGVKRKAEWFDLDENHNTYVYVSGLPKSMTEAEFIDLMKKYGIIAKKATLNNPYNIKMYKDSDGSFKGDALCCYARVESVDLALTCLDGYLYDNEHTLRCERAKFELKGFYDPTKKPRPVDKKAKMKHKKTIDKLLSWDTKGGPQVKQAKVILKHMFMPEEILEDATQLIELKQDVEDICIDDICEPKRVDIYDKHPEGVVAITFAEMAQAEKCIKILNNRTYAGRTVTAELWDGKTKYKIKETDEEAQQRLDKWHEDIQKSDDEDVEE